MSWVRMAMAGVVLSGFITTVSAAEPKIAIVDPHDAAVTATVYGNRSIRVDIHSRRGIGRATLVRKRCTWPDSLILRLHLRGLESLKLAIGNRELRMEAVGHEPGEVKLLVSEKDGKALPASSPLYPKVTRQDSAGKVKGTGYFDVVVPAPLLCADASRLEIRWIDFYR